MRRSTYILTVREGMRVEIPQDGYMEGSLGAVNRNFTKVDFTGVPAVTREIVSVIRLPVLSKSVLSTKLGGTAEDKPSSYLEDEVFLFWRKKMFRLTDAKVNKISVVTVTATVLVGVLLLVAYYWLPSS